MVLWGFVALAPSIGCGKHGLQQVGGPGSQPLEGGDEITLGGTFALGSLVEHFSKVLGEALLVEGAECTLGDEVSILSPSPVSRDLATHALVAALDLGGCALVEGGAPRALTGEVVRVADRAAVTGALAASEPLVLVHTPSNTLILAPTAPGPSDTASLLALLDERIERSRSASSSNGGVTRISATKFVIERDVADRHLSDLDVLDLHGRALPYRRSDGQVAGFRLAGLPREGLGHTLGIRNGDVVHAIAGRPVTSKSEAKEALTALQYADSFDVEITRDGQPLTLAYEVR